MANEDLKIVNQCLAAIGQRTVSTLDNPSVDTSSAIDMMELAITDFLNRGHWFNRALNLKLYPDANGKIRWPEGILDLKARNKGVKLVRRAGFVYDNKNFTYNLSKVTPNGVLEADAIIELELEDIPHVGQGIIRCETVINFVAVYGDSLDIVDTYVKKQEALESELLRLELDHQNYNAYETPMASQVIGASSGVSNVNPLRGGFGRDD